MHPQLLLSSPLSPEQRDIAETILDSGNSLLGILGDILDFSKLDQGEVVLKRQEMCLRGTIEACIEVRRGQQGRQDLRLEFKAWQLEEAKSTSPVCNSDPRKDANMCLSSPPQMVAPDALNRRRLNQRCPYAVPIPQRTR